MKHLKSYNESLSSEKFFTQEDLDDIKDVFRDFMDEYNMEWKEHDDNYDEGEYINLKFIKDQGNNYTDIITQATLIRFFINKHFKEKYGTEVIQFANEIINIKKRLLQMGYYLNISDARYFFMQKHTDYPKHYIHK